MSDLTVTCKKFYLPLSAMALLGIVMGILCPSIQVAVEPAQVLAGIVEYPRDNPFYIYQAKVWTILHQVTAVWLWLGMSDDMAFRILSCVGPFAGMLGMALVVRAVAPAHMMICVIPLFAFQIARGWGMNYPVLFAGAPHTYGLVGSQTVMLCLGLFAAGRPKLGAALLGVLPAIHPSLGVWAGLVIATGYAWHVRGRWRRMVPLLLPFGCGCLVTVISLTIHFGFFADVPSISAEEASIYHRAWIEHWDGHRKPLSWLKPQNAVLLSGFILSLAWLCCYRRKMTRNGAFILRVVFVAFAIGIPAVAITHISPERVPVIAVALMPTRPLNISVVLYPLLLMGFIWHFRRTVVVPAWLFLIVGLAATKIFPTPIEWALGTPLVLVLLAVVDRNKSLLAFGVGALALIGAVSLGSIGLLIIGVALPPVGVWLSRRPFCTRALHHGVVKRWWGGALTFCMLIIAVRFAVIVGRYSISDHAKYAEQIRSPAIRVARSREGGLALAPSLYMVQLVTRRPVPLDPVALDGYIYAMEGWPTANRCMRELYGVDLLDPPPGLIANACVPEQPSRQLWRERTPEEWQRLGKKYLFTDVLTPIGWKLNLPVIVVDARHVLYAVPDSVRPRLPAAAE